MRFSACLLSLQSMLIICDECWNKWDIRFNPAKTYFVTFRGHDPKQDARNRWCPHGTKASRASRCWTRHTSHKSCVWGALTADRGWSLSLSVRPSSSSSASESSATSSGRTWSPTLWLTARRNCARVCTRRRRSGKCTPWYVLRWPSWCASWNDGSSSRGSVKWYRSRSPWWCAADDPGTCKGSGEPPLHVVVVRASRRVVAHRQRFPCVSCTLSSAALKCVCLIATYRWYRG